MKKENPETNLKDYEEGIPKQKEEIKNNLFIQKLTKIQKDRALKGIEIYKTKNDFENELSICKDLRKNYRLLSNLVHPLPLSIERIDNDKGRGLRNKNDISYSIISMMLARRFLTASTVGIVDNFNETLGLKFKNEIDLIRPLINLGFD